MTTRRLWVAAGLATAMGISGVAVAGDHPELARRNDALFNFQVMYGEALLPSGPWQGHNQQEACGVRVDMQPTGWSTAIAFDFSWSATSRRDSSLVDEDGTEWHGHIKADLLRLDGGIRKVWQHDDGFTPYLGGGLSVVYFRLIYTEMPDEFRGTPFGWSYKDQGWESTGVGAWLNTGGYWTFDFLGRNATTLGFEVRLAPAFANVFGDWEQVGGGMAGVTAGFHH